LLGKQKAHEDEMAARQRAHLEGVRRCGDELIAAGHFGAEKIRARTEDIDNQWRSLRELAELRRRRLHEAVDFYQVRERSPPALTISLLLLVTVVTAAALVRDALVMHAS